MQSKRSHEEQRTVRVGYQQNTGPRPHLNELVFLLTYPEAAPSPVFAFVTNTSAASPQAVKPPAWAPFRCAFQNGARWGRGLGFRW